MNNNAKNKTKQIVGIGVMTAIIAVLSQITIPLPTHVPVTLQTFAVALAGYFLGWKGGAVVDFYCLTAVNFSHRLIFTFDIEYHYFIAQKQLILKH